MVQEPNWAAKSSLASAPFGRWEQGDDGRVVLVASRCNGCGETLFPERLVCPACRGTRLEQVRLAGPVTLYSFTVVHQLPAGFAAPQVVGYGRFPEGVQVFAPIDADPARLRTGALLALGAGVTKTDERGEAVVTYRFRPVVAGEDVSNA